MANHGGRRKNPSDVPPRTAARRAHHQTSFNQTCPIIHVGKGVPTTRRRAKSPAGSFPALPRRWAIARRAMVGSERNAVCRRSAMPAAAQQRQTSDRSADRRRRPPRHPQRPMDRADLGARAGLCAGQPRHPAGRARLRLHALLPAQSEALPAARGRRARRSPACRRSARDLDIRTDLCRYKVFRNGELVDEPTDIAKHWRDDLVIFALGCSFSFEDALMQDGIELRHITNGSTVPMYRTNRADHRRRPVPRPAGGVDAAAQARRRDPRRADHDALSRRARRAGASRHAGADRHQGHHEARLRRPAADERTTRCRCSGPAE